MKELENMNLITVFTPTYNRAYCLNKCYESIPNCFIDKDINPSVLLRVCTIWRVFNYQFFRVKINSLKYRFKNSDWKFTNVFK